MSESAAMDYAGWFAIFTAAGFVAGFVVWLIRDFARRDDR